MRSQHEGSDKASLLFSAGSAVCVILTSWLLELLYLNSASVVLH